MIIKTISGTEIDTEDLDDESRACWELVHNVRQIYTDMETSGFCAIKNPHDDKWRLGWKCSPEEDGKEDILLGIIQLIDTITEGKATVVLKSDLEPFGRHYQN